LSEEGQEEGTRENLRDEPLMMTQQVEHAEVHEHKEEHDIHSMHDESSLESQWKAQVGAMVKGVEHPFLGPTINEMQVDAKVSSRTTRLLDGSF